MKKFFIALSLITIVSGAIYIETENTISEYIAFGGTILILAAGFIVIGMSIVKQIK
jgi:NADH:ubiquinone oxidoreductase subunit 6 (subunit J)